MVDACYDRGISFGLRKCFLNDGAPWPKVVRNLTFLSRMVLVVYRRHGVFHPLAVLFSPHQFLGMSKPPKARNLGKKVVHLYRSTRQTYPNKLIWRKMELLTGRKPPWLRCRTRILQNKKKLFPTISGLRSVLSHSDIRKEFQMKSATSIVALVSS